MTADVLTRPVTTAARSHGHVHDRTCFWDVLACRWAGPAHPSPTPSVPTPRRSPEG